MRESIVMTLVGRDRPGLIEAFAAIVDEHGGNWEESRLVQLAGEFAGLVHVQVPKDRADALAAALRGIEGVEVVVDRVTKEEPTSEDVHFLKLDVVGQDHPGIVHRLSEAIAGREVSIEELETELVSAAMSGETLFQARARLRAPKSVSLEELTQDLEELAADLMVEITLEEPDDT